VGQPPQWPRNAGEYLCGLVGNGMGRIRGVVHALGKESADR
jgi:hypothetical protein